MESTDVLNQYILESLRSLSYITSATPMNKATAPKPTWCNGIPAIFVMGKARVAPLKPVTIPHLELTAATMAGHVDRMLRRELDLNLASSVFWTDSTAVLKYDNNETTRFRTFVANRVSEILKVSTASHWRHVSSKSSPSDYASRGQKADAFVQNQNWTSGPDFLTRSAESWPDNPAHLKDLTATDPEMNKNATINVIALEKQENKTDAMQRLIEHYSSWTRLNKAVAWILKTAKGRKERTAGNRAWTVDNLKDAELEIIRRCQKKKIQEEIGSLQRGEPVNRHSHIYKLDLIIQDGILRVGGRLSRSAMPEESKHPAILAKGSKVSKLILQEIHQILGHSGHNHILSKLSQKYWVPGASAITRRVLSKCLVCR